MADHLNSIEGAQSEAHSLGQGRARSVQVQRISAAGPSSYVAKQPCRLMPVLHCPALPEQL